MKMVLIPIEDSGTLPAMLATAALTAAAFDGHIEGVPLRIDFSAAIAAAGVGGPYMIEDFRAEDQERAEAGRRRFEAFMTARGFTLAGRSPGAFDGPRGLGPTAAFRDDLPPGDVALGQYARIFDLTVLGQPGRGVSPPRRATLESVLFESGRPILVAPPLVPANLGETVVIAWNASTETARAVAAATPFLRRAKRVVVISVEGGMVEGPPADAAARALSRSGIPAEARHLPTGRGTGETVLEQCQALGADLLIKGAYTQSRLRQMIFGGATSHILAMAPIPVLMAH